MSSPKTGCGLESVGRVADLHCMVSHRQPKGIAVDEQPNDNIVPLDGSGNADRLAGETLAPGPWPSVPSIAVHLHFENTPLSRATLRRHTSARLRAPLAHTPSGQGRMVGGRSRYGLTRFFRDEDLRAPSSSAACGTLGAPPGVSTMVDTGAGVVRRMLRVCTCSGRGWSALSTGTRR
jgi:hypothetical protein